MSTSTSSMMRVYFSSDDKAFHAFTDLVICTADKEKNLVALSVAGIDSAVKGFAALSHSNHSKLLWLEDPDKVTDLSVLGKSGKSVNIDGRQRFRSMTSKLIGGSTHAIILSVDAVAETESENPIVIAWDGNMDRAFLETLIAKYPIPLIAEWSTYLFNACKKAGYVEELTVISTAKPVKAIRLGMSELELADLVKKGFVLGALSIEEGIGEGSDLAEITNVTGYLNSYGNALAQRLGDVFQPHHKPGIDPLPPKINSLIRKPFKAQADVAYGLVKALGGKGTVLMEGETDSGNPLRKAVFGQKTALAVGEMGSGKTMIALVVAHLLHGDNYRVLIQAPGHLVKKWKREAEITIPGANAVILADFKDVMKLRDKAHTKPVGPEFYIISRDRAKLGYFQKAAAIWKSRKTKKRDYGEGWICPDCATILVDIEGVPLPFEGMLKMTEANLKCQNPECGTKLWSADNTRVRRMAPVELFKKYFDGFFDLFVPDEVHELKGSTAQGHTLGAFVGISKRTLALTGTLLGGYASNLFKILFRMDAKSLLAEDLDYKSDARWVGRYGVLEKVYKQSSDDEMNRMSKGGKGKASIKEKPGISPQVFTRFLLPRCAFLELADLSANLPKYTEIIELIEMDPELEDGYRKLASNLKAVLLEQLKMGSKKLLGAYLMSLLSYPDRPYGNEPICDSEDGSVLVTPTELSSSVVHNKEARLVELVTSEKKKGRKSMVYCQFTGAKDITPRLKGLLEDQGVRVEILRSTVKPENRESWVAAKVREGVDCIICNPKLVETGLDLLDFPTIIFYQTGYNLFTLRQASRRSWRIGQRHPVKVYFLNYADTLQEIAIRLMGSKLEAALSLEGKFSEEGLRSMGSGLDLSSALAKALVEGMDGVDSAESIWSRMGYGAIKSDDEDDAPVFDVVTDTGEVKTVKLMVVTRRKNKKSSVETVQYGWDFFSEGA